MVRERERVEARKVFIYPDFGLDTQSLLIAIKPKAFATCIDGYRDPVLSHMHLEDAFLEQHQRNT